MSPLFGKKCPKCEAVNANDAKFCASCGEPLSGTGGKVCGACGTDNRQDALFCRTCGRPLNVNQEADIRGSHWARREGDFAARIEVKDLPGLFNKDLVVEPGTQALLFAQGVPQEILPPGVYNLDSFGKTIASWFSGMPKTATALLVDVTPAPLDIYIPKCFTADPLPINLVMRMVVDVENAGKFVIAALHSRERYSVEELRNYVGPEVEAIADQYFRAHTLEQLVNNPATRKELELAVEEGLRATFNQFGLVLRNLRTAEMDLSAQEKIGGIKASFSLLAQEQEANLSGQALLDDIARRVDLQELVKDTAKVELEERKIALYERIRRTAQTDKMNEVRSARDFEKFIEEIDREKLFTEKEKQDLLKGWKEAAEDHDRERAFLLAKADVEQEFNIRAIKIKQNGELSLQEQDYQLELERIRTEKTLAIEEQKWEAEMRHRSAIHKMGIDEGHDAIDLLIKLKREKQELQWLEEEHALKMRNDEAKANIDREIQMMETRHRMELERLEQLGKLGTEALIAASPIEQATLLRDLKQEEHFKDMSEEQILAMAAAKSPDVARVFEEKYRAIAEGKASQVEHEMYEKLLGESKEYQRMLNEAHKDALDRLQQTSKSGLDAVTTVSVAYANKDSSPVVITGGGSGQVIHGGRISKPEDEEDTKVCPGCGRTVEVTSRFCQYCNNEFKDVK